VIVSRTPLRVPFAGGLTDLAPYAQRFGGATVSATIDAYVRVTLLPSLDGRFEVHAEGAVEHAARPHEVGQELVREALASVDSEQPPVRLAIWADLPGNSGLGTSGAVTVSLLHALRAARGESPRRAALAEEAAEIEVERLHGASGYHDAHVCARGGVLRLTYDGATVRERRLDADPTTTRAVERSLLLFATERQERTKPSLDALTARFEEAVPVLHDIRALADEATGAIERGDVARLAFCIGEQQRLKQLLPGRFVDEQVRDVTARVQAVGAAAQFPGGKIAGFVLVCCPEGQHDAVRKALPELRQLPLRFTSEGSVVVRV
jgi:D-glycero-alpha-D-manno-heptose-7-phosphate kinase